MKHRSLSNQPAKLSRRSFAWLPILLLTILAHSEILPLTPPHANAQVRRKNEKKVKTARKPGKVDKKSDKALPTAIQGPPARRKPPIPPSSQREGTSEAELNEDPESRSDWFIEQRLYPFDSFPTGARRRAWQSRPRREGRGTIKPLATSGWQAVGPNPTTPFFPANWGVTSGRINTVAVSPSNSQIVIVGSATGGIWRSTNSGNSFRPVSDDQVDLAVGAIAFAPSNPSIVYAGMGDTKNGYLGSGVLKSTDGGASWRQVNDASLPSPGTAADIAVDPSDPNHIYLAQYSRRSVDRVVAGGFYISTDGGVSWTRTLTGLPRDIQIHPSNRRTIYVGMARTDDPLESPTGLYRSTDSGATWERIYTTPYELRQTRDLRVAISAAQPQTIYVYTGGFIGSSLDVRVLVSGDAGVTWTNLGSDKFDRAQFGYNTYLMVDPNQANTLYLGSRDVYKSTDGGNTWTNLTRNFNQQFNGSFEYIPDISKTHPDQHAFSFAGNSNQFYVGNDGGLSFSNDGGNTFRSLNSTLSLTQFVGIALHPDDPSITYGGTQDNGTQRRVRGSSQWEEFAAGDGGRCVINPLDPGMVFTTYVRGEIYRFTNNGQNFDRVIAGNGAFGEPDEGGRLAFYPPFTGNGVDATLYFGTWRLFITKDLGFSWYAPAGQLDLTKGINAAGRDVLSAVGVSRSNRNVIYTGSAQGRAMLSTDEGGTWKDITTGLPNRFISSIAVDYTDPATAYLSVSGFRSGHVWKTTDLGSTWTDVSGNLPDVPASALLIDLSNRDMIYAGTDVGVFRLSPGKGWEAMDEGMPPAVVTAFAAHPGGIIQAATYGRGLYEFDSGQDRPSLQSVTYDGKKKLIITGANLEAADAVLINSIDKTSRVTSKAAKKIKLKGNADLLGLKPGDNNVQVVTSSGTSNTYVLKR